MEDTPIPRKSSRRVLYIIVLLGTFLISLTGLIHTKKLIGPDEASCRMVWMNPSYARIRSFDESHTKFASKYTMYLYREDGQDPVPNENDGFSILDGIPILFIPGNAGSYRQARSIASETSNLYFNEYVHHNGDLNKKTKNFDFFTADFNEDFTAFHGRTILDQAEYLNEAIKFILGLYSNNPTPPKSVILLAHSMGGIVARVMVTLASFQEGSVNTILTLASPHAASPLTFDGDLLKIYSAIDKFWVHGYENKTGFAISGDKEIAALAKERISNISIISITGGVLDTTLPADYTSLGYLVPQTNGFTVFTSGIPNVWTPVDHLAIVWCAQLRRTIAKVLLEITDVSLPERTFDLDTRMKVLRKYFLSGFEKSTPEMNKNEFKIKFDSQAVSTFTLGGEKTLKLDKSRMQNKVNTHVSLFQLPNDEAEGYQFSLLSSLGSKKFPQSEHLSVFLCKKLDEELSADHVYDFTDESTTKYTVLSCIDTFEDFKVVPRSKASSILESSFGGDKSPYHALQYDTEVLKQFDMILIKTTLSEFGDDDFVFGEISNNKSVNFELGKDLYTMFQRGGAEISIPSNRPLSINVEVPGAWSSLLAYKLRIDTTSPEAFSPYSSIIRQWREDPHETKWHINVDNKSLHLTMHGISPFVPFHRNAKRGLNIEIWSSPTLNNSTLDLTITIDFLQSFRLILLRYRLAVVSVCTLIVLLVILIQMQEFSQTSKFPGFTIALGRLNSSRNLSIITVILILLNFVSRKELVQQLMGKCDPVGINDLNKISSLRGNPLYKVNSYYLGLEEGSLWYLGLVFYFMGNFLVFTSYYVIVSAGVIVVQVVKFSNQMIKFCIKLVYNGILVKKPEVEKEKSPEVEEEQIEVKSINTAFNRRIGITVFLMGMISWYLPYQFIYVIAVVVQMVNVLKVIYQSTNDYNILNYQISILLLMLWILPVNVPILIVFIHNLTISWTTPFSSHHNILSILPILVMVQINNSSIRKLRMKFLPLISWFIVYFIGYCLIYGVRHTFWIHHLFNVLSCLLIVSLSDKF